MSVRTVANGGGNYNATGTWVEGAVPLATDDVVFTGTSGQLTVNVASVCLSINFANYTNQITFTNTLTVSGAVTLRASGFTTAGASGIVVDVGGTLTSNGYTWDRLLRFAGASAQIWTLADVWKISGTLDGGSTAFLHTINGNSFDMQGGSTITMSLSSANNGMIGTTVVNFTHTSGTVTWTAVSTSAVYRNTLNINTAGTLSIGNLGLSTGCVVNYTAGTITGAVLGSLSGTLTMNTNSMVWNSMTMANGTVLTLLSDLNISGNLTHNVIGSTTNTVNGLFNINIGGSFLMNGMTSGLITGTATFVMTGTGSISMSAVTIGNLRNSLTINTAGTITFLTNFYWSGIAANTSVFNYVKGTIVANGKSLYLMDNGAALGVNVKIDSNGFTWPSIYCYHPSVTFTGAFGFTATNFYMECTNTSSAITRQQTITLQSGTTYTITNFYGSGLIEKPTLLVASTPSSSALLNVSTLQQVAFCNATDIDSSGGVPIWNCFGTNTRTLNWGIYPNYYAKVGGVVTAMGGVNKL